uniref:hypothetical protein n=1 Tax=Flavobacterium sp. TaxID=239 RepID=UPI00404AC1D0
MIGLIFIYWLGKYFYKLAEEHKKSPWGFAILGIVTYYVSLFFYGFIIGIIAEIASPGFFNDVNDMLITLAIAPLAIANCYVLYKLLEKSWIKNKVDFNKMMEEIGEQNNS